MQTPLPTPTPAPTRGGSRSATAAAAATAHLQRTARPRYLQETTNRSHRSPTVGSMISAGDHCRLGCRLIFPSSFPILRSTLPSQLGARSPGGGFSRDDLRTLSGESPASSPGPTPQRGFERALANPKACPACARLRLPHASTPAPAVLLLLLLLRPHNTLRGWRVYTDPFGAKAGVEEVAARMGRIRHELAAALRQPSPVINRSPGSPPPAATTVRAPGGAPASAAVSIAAS